MKGRLVGKRFVVVGGGITGFSVADALGREGATVTVLDQNKEGAMMAGRYIAASPRAFAQIVPGTLAEGTGRDLAEAAFPLWCQLATEAALSHTAFDQCGWLACATPVAEPALRWYYKEAGKRWGARPYTKAGLGRVARFSPFRDTETTYALYDEKAASVYPPECLRELAAYLRRKGVTIRSDVRVLSIRGGSALLDAGGTEESIRADGFFVCSGNYRDLFASEYTSRGFKLRVLQMARTKVLPANNTVRVCCTGDTTIFRYGFTGGAPGLDQAAQSVNADLRRIDANVLFAPHPMKEGIVLSFGDTHAGETDHITFNPGDFEVLRTEAKRFVAEPFVPKLTDFEQCYVGVYPYFSEQGPFAESPVLFMPPGERVVCVMPTKGRGWTVAPALAQQAVRMWIDSF